MTKIYMSNVEGKPNHRALTKPLICEHWDGSIKYIPEGFEWDGSLVPVVFQGLFPRFRHPVASCRHDWNCKNAKNKAERAWADKQFEKDVGKTSWYLTKKMGYLGVRVGALLGIGNRF